jgi:hypothetical protein
LNLQNAQLFQIERPPMHRLSVLATPQALFMAATAFLAGCSGLSSSSIAPKPLSPQGGVHSLAGGMSSAVGPLGLFRSKRNTTDHFKSFSLCPAKGRIVYVSDGTNSVINIYTLPFAGQAPCGQLTTLLLNTPFGLYVKPGTHDLYVANASNVLVFHRGQVTPYNTYTDPSGQVPNDVTVAKDGTVIVSNLGQFGGPEKGSISTWIAGPNGGTFVGNFPMTNDIQGGFITVQNNGTIYFDDQDATTRHGAVWSVSCPAGVCGTQTRLAGVSLGAPGGLGSDNTEDLLVTDSQPGKAETFELPNPNPKAFPLNGIVFGMAINRVDRVWFVADALNNNAAAYSYPSGKLLGTVPGNPGGNFDGIAIDPGHAP